MGSFPPIKITLYGEEDEILSEHTRMFVPVRIFETAIELANELGGLAKLDQIDRLDNIDPQLVHRLAGLIAAEFGNKVSVEDVLDHCDIGEMMVVLKNIMSRVRGIDPNPTPPGR